MYWFFVLPLGFLLTMYTFTGYDASAHLWRRPTTPSGPRPAGFDKSILYSAVGGWALLLAITFAATHVRRSTQAAAVASGDRVRAAHHTWAKLVLDLSTVGQLFCGMGCVAAASRMVFAFSRDGAVPGHKLWRRLNEQRTPTWSVLFVVVFALVITIPALFGNSAGFPVAFFAVTSITTIGLYIAYVLPVFLRLRHGGKFEAGVWNLGKHYRWINPIAIIWVALCVVIFCLPTSPDGGAVEQRLQLERLQLRAARYDRAGRSPSGSAGRPAPSTRSRARSGPLTSRTPARRRIRR